MRWVRMATKHECNDLQGLHLCVVVILTQFSSSQPFWPLIEWSARKIKPTKKWFCSVFYNFNWKMKNLNDSGPIISSDEEPKGKVTIVIK